MIFCVYGVPNGHTNKRNAAITSSLIAAIKDEMAVLPTGPKLIIGDINADPQDINELKHLLRGGWVDVGATRHMCEGVVCQATCASHNPKASATRRDYMFASPEAAPMMRCFKVTNDDLMDTHSRLEVTMRISDVLTETKHFWGTQ